VRSHQIPYQENKKIMMNTNRLLWLNLSWRTDYFLNIKGVSGTLPPLAVAANTAFDILFPACLSRAGCLMHTHGTDHNSQHWVPNQWANINISADF